MSMPNIPNVDANINIKKEDAINILLASVGFEELALSHILNAEGEKIQSTLGTLEGQQVKDVAIDDLLKVNNSVRGMLRDTVKQNIVLGFKLGDVIEYATADNNESPVVTTTTSTTTPLPTTSTTTEEQ